MIGFQAGREKPDRAVPLYGSACRCSSGQGRSDFGRSDQGRVWRGRGGGDGQTPWLRPGLLFMLHDGRARSRIVCASTASAKGGGHQSAPLKACSVALGGRRPPATQSSRPPGPPGARLSSTTSEIPVFPQQGFDVELISARLSCGQGMPPAGHRLGYDNFPHTILLPRSPRIGT